MNRQESQQRRFSNQDLAAWGVNHIAYVKGILQEGEKVFSVHAADGTQIAVMPSREIAFSAIRQHDLEPVSVH